MRSAAAAFCAVAIVPALCWSQPAPDPWGPIRRRRRTGKARCTSTGTPARLVFESDGFENFSNKWRARETCDLVGPDEMIETFELAPPDKPFEIYSRNRLKRVPSR